jgi:hypothetical protein
MALLEAASSRWCDYRKRRYECGSWELVVRSLATNLAPNKALSDKFRDRYPSLLVIEPLSRGVMSRRNARAEALAWMRVSGESWQLVQSEFRKLGYPTLEEECGRRGGFLRPIEPSPEARQRIEILRRFVNTYFVDLIPLVPLPPIEIVEAKRPGWGGRAMCRPLRKGPLSSFGRRVRYTLDFVSLSCESIRSPTPQQALATLLHELCHAFGTDRAANFGAALTDVMERMAALSTPLQILSTHWSGDIIGSSGE